MHEMMTVSTTAAAPANTPAHDFLGDYAQHIKEIGGKATLNGPNGVQVRFRDAHEAAIGNVALADAVRGVELTIVPAPAPNVKYRQPTVDEAANMVAFLPGVLNTEVEQGAKLVKVTTSSPFHADHLRPLLSETMLGYGVVLEPIAAG